MRQISILHDSSSFDERYRQLEYGLVGAAGKLRAGRLRQKAVKATARSLQFLSVSIGVGLFLVLSGKIRGNSTLIPAMVLIFLGIVASGTWFLAMLWPEVRRGLAWIEAAERLDLATGDHNAIATALEFARSGGTSSMADQAIAIGLLALETYAAVTPASIEPNAWPLRSAGVSIVAAAVFLFACTVPGSTVRSILALSPAGPRAATVWTKAAAPRMPSADAAASKLPDSMPSSPANARPTASAAEPAASSGLVANAGGDGLAAQSAAMASAPAPSRSNPARRSAPKLTDADARPSANRSAAGQSKPSGAGQSDSTDRSSSNGTANGAAAGSDSNSNPPQEAADQRDDLADASTNGLGLLPDDKAKSESAPGEPSGSTKVSEKRGAGKGSSDQSGDQSGTSGSSAGQNASKKSRGVAPLMLGSRQADLVKGRPLSGPDQRTPIQMPPMLMPLNPAATANAVPDENPEPATHVFRVTSAERTTVDAYFQNLHAGSSTD